MREKDAGGVADEKGNDSTLRLREELERDYDLGDVGDLPVRHVLGEVV